jgi:uncharacterized protein YdaU (DUF1376 family)
MEAKPSRKIRTPEGRAPVFDRPSLSTPSNTQQGGVSVVSKEKSPAFQFYPSDFIGDENVLFMSMERRGLYITLLCICWKEGSIPADPDKISTGLHVTVEDAKAVLEMFKEPPEGEHPGRLIHKRLEEERTKQKSYREAKREAGRKGGESKAKAKQKPSKALAKAKQKLALQSSSSSSTTTTNQSQNICSSGDERMDAGAPASAQKSRARQAPPEAAYKLSEDGEHRISVISERATGSDEKLWTDSVRREAERKRQATNLTSTDNGFGIWYATYPRKVGKRDAQKAWRQNLSALSTLETFGETWFNWRPELERRDTDMVPYPATFIRSRCWEEPPPEPVFRDRKGTTQAERILAAEREA